MSLRFSHIAFSYTDKMVLKDVDLTANTGEITCLLGVSGSGKSTLLRLAAGTERVQQGEIYVNDTVLANAKRHPSPEQRPVGMMFQENALFPHMTIAQNIAFGLHKQAKAEKNRTVKHLLALVGLSGFESRYPDSLSGGQQQRIALARSLAPNPDVLLMDEPYANIDIGLRRTLRESARLILKKNQTTTILVTHDPQEAIEMADKIAVLDAGRIIQVGSPETLYKQPNSAQIACLFAQAQIISGVPNEQGFISNAYGLIKAPNLSADVTQLAVRASALSVQPDANADCEIVDIRFVGEQTQLHIQKAGANGATLRANIIAEHSYNIGEKVSLHLNTNRSDERHFFTFNH